MRGLDIPASHFPDGFTMDISQKTVGVTVFVPAHNEEGNIPLLIEKIAQAFKNHGVDGEIVLVDDGSNDGTLREAEEARERYPFLRIFTHRRKLGQTEAMKTGFANARGERIVFLCADLESDPEEDIPQLLGKLDQGFDMVVGWRQGRSGSKVPASWVANLVCRWLFDVNVHDMNWVKAFSREVMEELNLRSDWHRFIYLLAAAKGYRVAEVPTNYYPRKRGHSQVRMVPHPDFLFGYRRTQIPDGFQQKTDALFRGCGGPSYRGWGCPVPVSGLPLVDDPDSATADFTLAVMFVLSGLQLFVTGFLADLVVGCDERVERLERSLKKGTHAYRE